MKRTIYDVVTKKTSIIEVPDEPYVKLDPQPPTVMELLQAEIIALKARLAKVEAVPIVKTALEPVIKDPILTR